MSTSIRLSKNMYMLHYEILLSSIIDILHKENCKVILLIYY